MMMLLELAQMARSPGDPKVLDTGPSSLLQADRLARGLGWFSLALGLTELLSPRSVTRALGMEGKERLIQAYGAREIGAGLAALSVDKTAGMWSRVGGDALDLATLALACRSDNPKRTNVKMAIAAVVGITLLDVACATSLSASHGRSRAKPRDYSRRSGFPKGLAASRGLARADRDKPADGAETASPPTGDDAAFQRSIS